VTAGPALRVADADEVDGLDSLQVAYDAGGVDLDAARRARATSWPRWGST